MPWDIDFVLGDGNGSNDGLWGGQDPVANQLFNVPAYRRMLWRAFQDAINGPMRPENYGPQVDARRAMLLKNGVPGLSDPRGIKSYLEARRNYLQNQLKAADTQSFAVTSDGGTNFTTASSVATLSGTAPFALATIEINGIPYPVTWTAFNAWRLIVPLGAATNPLQIIGRDLRGVPVPGASADLVARYTGAVPSPEDWVVINEVMFHAPVKDAEYVELFNRHPSATLDLSGYQLGGLGFSFPPGTFLPANGYLLVVKDRAAFAAAYGSQIQVAGEFSGRLDNGGETLRLLKPHLDGVEDTIVDDVRYDNAPPWPAEANGTGASLQLIDPAQDNWRVGNWAATAADNPDRVTPGRGMRRAIRSSPFRRSGLMKCSRTM